jgi:hypothetical protein
VFQQNEILLSVAAGGALLAELVFAHWSLAVQDDYDATRALFIRPPPLPLQSLIDHLVGGIEISELGTINGDKSVARFGFVWFDARIRRNVFPQTEHGIYAQKMFLIMRLTLFG